MQDRFRDSTTIIVAASVLAVLSLSATSALAHQAPAYCAPRFPGTQNPDLNGVWQVLNTANWNVEPHAAGPSPLPALRGVIAAEPAGQGVIVEGGKIPYQPAAEAKRKENFEKRLNRPTDLQSNETTGDPEAKCYLPGVPRARYTPIDANHLMYEARIEDPKVFTRPWTIRMPLYRRIEVNAQLLEFKCVEFAEEFVYGRLIDK